MKTNTCSVIFATLLALAIPQYIEAHGYMKQVTIDGGTPYSGIKPESTAINKSPIRAITDQSPIKDPNSKEMACGKGARNTLVVATAKPGSKITIAWGNYVAPDDHWIHNTGPLMVFFAQVPKEKNITTFKGTDAQWFKTDQLGKQNGVWAQAALMAGKTISTTVPKNLPNGYYLVRQEIIGLHVANVPSGAEFYPACFQLHIQNSPTGDAPLKVTPTVKFPGAYSANDPGILVDAFSGQPYQFPGGEIATISNSGTARSVKPRHARRTLRWARHRMH